MKGRLKKYWKWLLVLAVVAVVLVYLPNFIKNKIIARSFFKKYDVLTAIGNNIFSYNSIALNGKIIEKTDDEWTNVLPVPNSLEYILATSSYSKGKDIKCGDEVIPKAVDSMGGENQWCIKHNSKSKISTAATQYYPYDTDNIVYEACLESGYYETIFGNRGFNGCAEVGLFLNDKLIAKTVEQKTINPITGKEYIQDASTFNYHPSKKVGSRIIYSTANGTYAYDTRSQITEQLTNNENSKLEDIFLTDDGKTILVTEQGGPYENAFLGIVQYEGRNYSNISNIYSADYIDGNFYILRLVEVKQKESSGMSEIITYELLKNGKKIENLEIDSIAPPRYNVDAIVQFPLCDTDTIVCVYEDGHYAYKNRTLIPEIFSYDFYVDEMVIDGEWRGEHIPNFIGHSKPIFENSELTHMIYLDFMNGELYVADLSKEWSFKSLYFNSRSAVSKILSGRQNKLLNVVKK